MITLQLKRTAKNISDNSIKDLVLENGEPLLVKSLTVPTSTKFNLTCNSPSNHETKTVTIPVNQSSLFIMEDNKPKIGTTLFIKFDNENTVPSTTTLKVNIRQGLSFTRLVKYIDSSGNYYDHIYSSQYNWSANETRVFVFDGNYWVIQLPEYYLENSVLFIGDGINTVSYLYNNGTYIDVSKYISGDNIENGSITIDKLDPDIGLVTSSAMDQSIADAIGDYSALVDSNFAETDEKIQLGKIYYVTCNTPGNNQLKTVNIDNLPTVQDVEDYDGLTLVIKFSYKNTYGSLEGQNDNIALKVRNSDGTQTLIDSYPLYVGNNPLGKAFYWNDNDTLIFVFNPNYNTGSSFGCWNMAGTSASTIIANWCKDNDTTVINGAAIATGTIAADSIMSNSITAQQIAVGSLPSTVFNNDLQSIIGNLDTFKQQCASAGGIVAKCETVASESCKLGEIPEDALFAISTTVDNNMHRWPLVGTSVVVKFDYANTNFGTNGITFAFTTDGTNKYFEAPIGFYFNLDESNRIFVNIGDGQYSSDTESPIYEAMIHYRWADGDYRTLMYDGVSGWIITTTSSYLQDLASYCLTHNQTWIGGGTIITGTIVAEQIQSGLLDTAKVQLVCYGLDANNTSVKNYGGLRYAEGDAGTPEQIVITRGIELYGSVPMNDPDGEPDNKIVITNAGMRLHIEDGSIQGYGKKWFINALNGIYIGNENHIPVNPSLSDISIYQLYAATDGTLKIKLP